MSAKAYQAVQNAALSPRSAEYTLLAQITGQIEKTAKSGDRIEMIRALHRNVEVWTTFEAVCLEKENKLPDDLKAKVISLAIWVGKHTRNVLNGGASVDSLVFVNHNIMKGLAGRAEGAHSVPAGES